MLDLKSARFADQQLYESFPELNGRALTVNDTDAKYREAWWKLYYRAKSVGSTRNPPAFTNNPIGLTTEPCPLKSVVANIPVSLSVDEIAKKQRIVDRNNLIAATRLKAQDAHLTTKQRENLINAASRLERDNRAVERARLSQAVYDSDKPDPVSPLGWSPLNEQELMKLGVTPDMLIDKNSGFKAQVYQSKLEQPPVIVIAFAGTEDEPADRAADFRQAIGEPEKQYDEAIRLTQVISLNAEKSGQIVETTGHSLGGGLASAGSAITGVKGSTFNGAGLHENTTARLNLSPSDRLVHAKSVDAFYNTSDPLNGTQDNREKILSAAKGIRQTMENLSTPPGPRPDGLLTGPAYDIKEATRKALLAKAQAAADALTKSVADATGMDANDVRALLNDPEKLQNALPVAYGNRHPIEPAAEHKHSWLELLDSDRKAKAGKMALDGHGIGPLIDAIEGEKSSDIATMKKI